ncbi:MAG: hypothetical protein OXR84_05615 [Magnetovibrio sp.]|nr:hypothetical protein [Magnetovibrio sp.]
MNGTIAMAPLLPVAFIAGFAAVGLLLCLVMAWRRGGGALWRAAAVTALTLMALNPRIVDEQRESQTDVVAVLVDRTSSQRVGDRPGQTDAALAHLRRELGRLDGIDVREIEIGDAQPSAGGGEEGSLVTAALRRAIGAIPKKRLAGAVIVTDGQVHDTPPADAIDAPGAPVHVLLTGEPDEVDRRLVIDKAPAYGLVGKEATIAYRVEDRLGPGAAGLDNLARVTVREGDKVIAAAQVPVGRLDSFTVPLTHAGPTVLTLEVAPVAGELSALNNRALVTINGVRERLRVLLVSGQPHAGERVWRNLLKSDPAVDLVHFTILRPPEKEDFTPLNEISLIAFPTRELFEVKLKEFDMVVFDRYVVRDVLPPSYLRNIIGYVNEGGALLLSVGPEFASERSLFNTPLGGVLPAAPTGQILETGFRPEVTEIGDRHPVTAALPKARADRANRGTGLWGRWFRQIEAAARAGHTVMQGPGSRPLLVLDRAGDGRVAAVLSDHIWLWARGFEGGGPHAELLRRLAHWLMKEPDLEEEGLRAEVRDGKLHIVRRSLRDAPATITVTAPSGARQSFPLETAKTGASQLVVPAEETGLYRVGDGERDVLAASGSLNPLEFADLRATAGPMTPLAAASGGGVRWIRDGLPDLRKVRADRDQAGRTWLGLVENRAYVVTGVTEIPLVPPILFMIAALLVLMAAWYREGR